MKTETWRKKSITNLAIEVVRVRMDNTAEIAEWCGGTEDHSMRQPGVFVPVEYGDRERAGVGDFVFKAGKTEFRVQKPRAFVSLWEAKPPTR